MPKKDKQPNPAAQLTRSLGERLIESLQTSNKRLDEQSAEGALARGRVFQMASYFVEAAECYTEALAFDPELDEAAARMVVVQLKAQQPEKALDSAMKLAARNPGFEVKELSSDQYASAMTLLGDALAHNDRLSDAIEAYKSARSVSSRDSFAAGRLAQLFLATGEPKKAVEQAKNFANNPRFQNLSKLLSLSRKSETLLPMFNRGSVSVLLANTAHGRPILVEGMPRVASIAWGDDHWCADLSEESSMQ